MSKRFPGVIVFLLIIFAYPFSGFGQNFFYHLLGLPTLPPFTWTGIVGDNSWNTAGNWSDNLVPGVGDIAKFKGGACSGANCNVNVNINVSVAGVDMDAAYTGTITQLTTRTITVGTSGWVQVGGTFAGGDSNITFNKFALSGGSFTSSSSNFSVGFNIGSTDQTDGFVVSGGSFFHNNGTVQLAPSFTSFGQRTLMVVKSPAAGLNFFNLTLNATNGVNTYAIANGLVTFDTSLGAVNISNNFNFVSGYMNGGTMNLSGNYSQSCTGDPVNLTCAVGGTTKINFVGAAQTYASTQSTSKGPEFSISGSVVTPAVGTSDLQISKFNLSSGSFLAPTGNFSVGLFIANVDQTDGFVVSGGSFLHNTGTVVLNGYGGNFSTKTVMVVKAPAAGIDFYNLTMNVTNTPTTYDARYMGVTFDTSLGSLNVLNNFNFLSGYMNGGTLNIYGNYSQSCTGGFSQSVCAAGGSTILSFIGAGQTYASTQTTSTGPKFSISGSAVTPAGGTTDIQISKFNLSSGSFLAPTGNFSVGLFIANVDQADGFVVSGGSFLHNTGTVVLNANGGNWTPKTVMVVKAPAAGIDFYNLTMNATNTPTTYDAVFMRVTFDTSLGSLNVLNNFIFLSGYMNGGALNIYGNYSQSCTGGVAQSVCAAGGTTQLTFAGANAESFTTGAGSSLSSGNITVNKNTLNLTLSSNLSATSTGQSLNISSGTLDMSGRNLSVNSTLTIGASGKLICGGGTPTYGTLVLAGQIVCGPTIGITWTGLAGDHLWNTAGNWTNNTVPGASDMAYFNSYCSGANCNVTVNVNPNVKGIVMDSSYTGTITQSAGVAMTIGTSGWTQGAGTFVGGNSAITLSGNFNLSGGAFTSTTSSLVVSAGNFTVSGSPTFNANSGLISFEVNGVASRTWTPGSASFYDVQLYNSSTSTQINISGTLTVDHTLTLNTPTAASNYKLYGGTILAKGDVTQAGVGQGFYGTTLIKINGNANQTITSNASGWSGMPNFEIASTGGTVTFSSNILAFNETFTYTSGTVDASISNFVFTPCMPEGSMAITPGSMVFNNVTFTAWCTNTETINGTMTVNGHLTLRTDSGGARVPTLNSGTILALGDITLLATNGSAGWKGTTNIKISGSGNQTVNGTAAYTAYFPSIEIASTGGIVTFLGYLEAVGNFIYTSGTVDASASHILFTPSEMVGGVTLTPGPITFNEVYFVGWSSNHLVINGTLVVNGLLTFSSDSQYMFYYIDSGTILAKGDILSFTNNGSYGFKGTALVKVAGSTNQTITGNGGAITNFEIASTGGTVTLTGTSLWIVGNYTYTSGTVDASTSTLWIWNPQTTTTITPGAVAYNNVTISGYQSIFNIVGTLTANGTLLLGEPNNGAYAINGGALMANGNVNFANYGYGGTTVLTMAGSTAATLSIAGTAKTLSTPIAINKSGGATVSLIGDSSISTAGQDLSLIGGVLDLAGYDLTVADVLTVGAGTILKCSGGSFFDASLVNSGTIDCPGYGTYSFYWTGGGGDSNWNTAGNWSGGNVPTSSDIAIFDSSYCGGTCNATMNVDPNVRGVWTLAGYAGTITQSAGLSMTIGKKGWSQVDGVFVGNNSQKFFKGDFKVTGGALFTPGTGQYNFLWDGVSAIDDYTIQTPGIHLADVFFANKGIRNLNTSTLLVDGHLTLAGNVSTSSITNGTIQVMGDITTSAGGETGSALVTMTGSNAQTITHQGFNFLQGDFTINKASGTVTLAGHLPLTATGQDLTLTSGTMDIAGNVLNVKNSLNLAGGTTLNCNGGAYTHGSLTNSGTINCPTTSYVATVLADTPTAYWRFGEASSALPAYDVGGNNYIGTYNNPADISFGVGSALLTNANTAVSTNSNSGAVTIPTLSLGATWAIEVWFKYPLPTTGTGWNTLVRGSSDHQVLINVASHHLGSWDNVFSTGFHDSGFDVSTLSAGWHHLVVNASGGTTTFYIDKVNVGSFAYQSQNNVQSLGNIQPSFGQNQAFGAMDELAIYNHTLSPAQITNHYTASGR